MFKISLLTNFPSRTIPSVDDVSDARRTISPGASNKYSASTTSRRSTIPEGICAEPFALSRDDRRPNMAPS